MTLAPVANSPLVRRPAPPAAPAVQASAAAKPAPAAAPGSAPAWQTELIRLTGEAVAVYQQREAARARFAAGQLDAPALHRAEAAMEAAYATLRRHHDGVGGLTRLKWKLQGFDLEGAWRAHGLPLPHLPGEGDAHGTAWSIAAGASLAITTGSVAVLALAPGLTTFAIAGPLALVSGLLGGALVLIKGNGAMHAGEVGPDRVPERPWLDAGSSHYAGASPGSYQTALIHLGTVAKMAEDELAAVKALEAKGQASADHVRLARLALHEAYRDLHALAGSVSEVKAAAWQAQGFDVQGAWKRYAMPLPPIASLDRAPVVPALDEFVRTPAKYLGGLIAAVAGAIVADLANAGRVAGPAARLLSAIYRVHPLFAIVVVGGAGYFLGAAVVDGMNQLVGPKTAAKAPKD